MSNEKETTENPLDGFKTLNAEVMADDSLEVENVESIPEIEETLAQDTGVVDKTEEEEEEVEEPKKVDLTPQNLEIEVKKEVEETEEEEEEVEETTDEVDVSQIGVLAKYLKEEGVVDYNDEDFEDTEEGLLKVIESEINKGVENYKKDLPQLAQEFIEYISKGGDPSNFVQANSDVDFNKITPDHIKGKENIQKQIVAELMRREGYNQEEIIADITDFVDSGIIERRANQSLTKLKRLQETKRARLLKNQEQASLNKKKEYDGFLTSLQTDINDREEIAGFNITKRQKKDFYEYITKKDRKTGKTRLMKDSEKDTDSQLKMAWLYYNNFDFSKVEKKARTKAASSLRKNLERAGNVSTRKLKSKTRTKATGADVDFSLFEKALGNK